MPFWNYFLLKFQFFALYFIAGWKKLSSEWLYEWQYSMTNLSDQWVFAPFRMVIGSKLTDLLIVHWFAAIFDLTIAFFLIYKKSRPIATLFASAFHLMNSCLFEIGMFPWVCLVELPLFYEHKWPYTLWRKLKCSASSHETTTTTTAAKRMSCVNDRNVTTAKRTLRERFTTFLILIYCCLQLFLPFSHFITMGFNNWVDGIYGYSFDMMMHNWRPSLISIKIVDNNNQNQHFIEPLAFTDSYRWTQYPDMAFQYAKCIKENLQTDFHENPNSVLSSTNFSIYFDIWCSLNGRIQQRIYDPKVDLGDAKVEWHPFIKPSFTLPLLREYSHLRKEIAEISRDVYSWNNYTDLMFFADFPQLTMENYIVPEMDNVSLTVLHGAVKFKQENDTKASSLSKGQSILVHSGSFHKVTTISEVPSCYYYTYINATQQLLNIPSNEMYSEERQTQTALPLAQGLRTRWENYKKFLYHVANSILFEFYSVPMPRRIREIHEM